ncbi:MAG: sterol desaturase family protein [Pseudomonadales bacterium]|nr:sterol desaturase family protein [Pseudomonadales bacterium]
MTERILTLEPLIRFGVLLGMLTLMAIWEMLAPRRALTLSKAWRWLNNGSMIITGTLLTRLVFPAGLVGLALFVESRGWGLLQVLEMPAWVAVLIAVVVLDFTIWVQHVLFHAVPALWRLHRMHHADLDFDLSTGLRFHPLELLLSYGVKATVVVAIGAPVLAVLIFEIILNSLALFNHSNVRLPLAIDRVLRRLIVTPDFHRVHHSWHADETNSNFGFNLSLWDRFLGTYRPQPRDGHTSMTIGLKEFRDPAWERFDRMLIQPFMQDSGSYSIQNRDQPDD